MNSCKSPHIISKEMVIVQVNTSDQSRLKFHSNNFLKEIITGNKKGTCSRITIANNKKNKKF